MTQAPGTGGYDRHVCNSQRLYLDLLLKSILGLIYEDPPFPRFGSAAFDLDARIKGLDWPTRADTMVGLKRLMNVRQLAENVLWENVEGDFLEAGVWRGGVGIMMRGVLSAYGVTDRRVWLADSFEGLPAPNREDYPPDSASVFHTCPELSVDIEKVKQNFRKYDLLDDQVVFLKGWFKDTLPRVTVPRISLLRLDGDLYESTMQALVSLYDKVSENGYVIIDDYHCVPQCEQAVEDFCARINIAPAISEIDGVGVYWQKTSVSAGSSAGSLGASHDRAPAAGNDEREAPGQAGMEQDGRFVKINQVLNKRYVQLAERDALIAQRDARLAESISERDVRLAELDSLISERDVRLAESEARVAELDARVQELTNMVELMENSRSWRITAPLRYMTSDLFRKK